MVWINCYFDQSKAGMFEAGICFYIVLAIGRHPTSGEGIGNPYTQINRF